MIIIMLILLFTVEELIAFIQRKDAYVMTTFIEDNYDQETSITSDDGFFFAFAVVDKNFFAGESDQQVENLLELRAYEQTDRYSVGQVSQALDLHLCNDEELDLAYSIEEYEHFTEIRPFLFCMNQQEIKIKGGLNELDFYRPTIEFRIPDESCRDDEYDGECIISREQQEQLSKKMIITFTNQMSYDNEIKKKTKVELLFFPERSTILSYAVERTRIKTDNNLISDLYGLNQEKETIFTVKKLSSENRSLNYHGRLQIQFVMSDDMTVIESVRN